MSKKNKGSESAVGDLLATCIVAFFYFAYMLSSVDLRQIFARPISAKTVIPWGLAGGVAMVVLVMAAAGLYMMFKNLASEERVGDRSSEP